ncbi:MAG: PaaI family thioesterase [Deltaproteobacteria bacterium]|nr:PaaI family thioesterase [Deltaproteobacteria bacterium]MBW1955336.1 PaaI family thioesterase [Deltaproteobacteria bacterium]MBW2041992.1 PaaI family thioesterase [Deltaproteobacteria bacterium]MBW2132358.1 PaaI family thioesterase [Deltaproteobacteria bacterium]
MDPTVKKAIFERVASEPFARTLDIRLVELEEGFSAVEMVFDPKKMNNIYGRAHGGAVFALIDEAFQTVGQWDGTIGVALNVNVTYVSSPAPGTRLRAEAREVSRTKKTAGYQIMVTDSEKALVATCQALLYRTGKPIPFL